MQLPTQASVHSTKSLWAGRIVSGLVTAFLLFDAIIHLMKPAPVGPQALQMGRGFAIVVKMLRSQPLNSAGARAWLPLFVHVHGCLGQELTLNRK